MTDLSCKNKGFIKSLLINEPNINLRTIYKLVKSLNTKERVIWLLALVISWILLAPALASIGAAATWPDSFILLGSWIAQILMVRQKFEAWPIWFVVDFVATIHYARQDLWFTSLLYIVFTIIAVIGWRKWQSKAQI